MRMERLPERVDLTYCTNIHVGESWEEISASIDANVPVIRQELGFEGRFGIGLRLSAMAARVLAEPGMLAVFMAQLDRLNAYVFTINAFPYGPFHGVRIKEQVYLPDWRSEERLAFTLNAARILSALLPPDCTGSISTVPGAFRAGVGASAIEAITAGLVDAVAALVRIARDGGRTIVLALEPEPSCLLETVEETVAFFTDHLFAAGAAQQLAAATGLPAREAVAALRRHLGVCYDVCHGAVEFEAPLAALRRLQAAGITVAKIQLSTAIRVAGMTRELAGLLRAFDDGEYLHQTVVRDDQGLTRFTDLPDALAAFERGTARGEWRVHCHVPLFLPDLGRLGSTHAELAAVLDALRTEALSPHLEVETYTWDVLPASCKTRSQARDIARELRFVMQRLDAQQQEARAAA